MAKVKALFRNNEVLMTLILLIFFVFFSVTSKNFFTVMNMMQILQKSVELCILTLGMAICIITTGGVDLSIASLCSFNTSLIALMNVRAGFPIPLALAVSLAVSLSCGLLNGYLIGYLNLAPILVTLGTQALFTGLGLLLTSGTAISGLPASFTALGNSKLGGVFPVQVFFLVAVFAIMYLITSRTRLGRNMYLTGTNRVAADFTGINSRKTILITFTLSSMMAFLCAIILTARLATGRPDLANNYLTQAIAAAVFGGISITGGKGSLLGCALGVLIFQMMSNGLTLLLPSNASFYEQIMIGVLLLGLLVFKSVRKS